MWGAREGEDVFQRTRSACVFVVSGVIMFPSLVALTILCVVMTGAKVVRVVV